MGNPREGHALGDHSPGGLPEGRPLEGQTVGSSNLQEHRPALGHNMPEAGEGQGADPDLQVGTLVLTASPWHVGQPLCPFISSLGHRDNKRTHLIGMLWEPRPPKDAVRATSTCLSGLGQHLASLWTR